MSAVAKASREPTGTISAEPARIKLQPLGTPLRALARAHSDGRLVLEAELPWLQLGASCTAELHDGRSIDGKVHWIGLDMTRSGTARLRILVDTDPGKSIQLSLHDADVQELSPTQRPKRARWLWPAATVLLAVTAGWLGARLMTPHAQLLSSVEPVGTGRVIAPPPIVKIPAESLQIPTTLGDIAVVVPIVAPGAIAPTVLASAPTAPTLDAARAGVASTPAKKARPANRAAASRTRRNSKP